MRRARSAPTAFSHIHVLEIKAKIQRIARHASRTVTHPETFLRAARSNLSLLLCFFISHALPPLFAGAVGAAAAARALCAAVRPAARQPSCSVSTAMHSVAGSDAPHARTTHSPNDLDF